MKTQEIYDKIIADQDEFFAEFFFSEGSITGDLATYCPRIDDWNADPPGLAQKELESLRLDGTFDIVIEEDPADEGRAYFLDGVLHLPSHSTESAMLLHETIHMLEKRLGRLPSYYRDGLIMSLYRSLLPRINELDDMLSDLLCLVEHEGFRLQTVGRRSSGNHDLLFILKAFDLDLRLHWPLGTVLTSGSSDFEHRFENAVFDSE